MHKHLNTETATFSPAPRSRRTIAWLTLLVYAGQPLAATAQVVADQAAPAQKRPVIDTTANAIPLVQIATPNASGLSHNQYTQYNVDPGGIILNNSNTSVLTQQAGYVPGNQNMANGTARIILNEVTSTSLSQLNGYTEVAGSRAEVIIANPNGISCNGCGFINTSRGVLTTGTPVFGGSGSLDAFRVNGGEINIGSSGLNASNTDQLDLISRSVKVNGELWGKVLNVITGTNQVNYANLGVQVISGDANKPTVGIDVARLGGMYANKIRLIGTEAGVGVNSQGNTAAQAGDITIDNQGLVTLAGNTIAAGNLSISGTSISSTGNLGAGIDANGVATRNGTLVLAATDPTGSITNSGRIAGNTITSSSDTFTNTGTVIGDNITLRANTLNNLNASAIIASTQSLDLIIQNALENRDGATLYSLGDINIGSNNVIGADGYLTGRASSVNNQSATIEAGNDLRISADQITNKRSVMGVEWAPEILGAYVSGNPRYTPSYSDQQFTANTTPAAQLLAGNNMWLSTGTIINDYSSIAAGQTLTSNATTVNNTGAAFLQRMTVTNGLQDNWVWVETGWHWGVDCGWTGCWPVTVPEYGLRNFPIAYAPAPTYTTLGPANVTYAANTPLASQAVDSAALKAPSSGLYTIHNQPGQPYLIVTDARFISYQNFLSSDYMMSRLALDPALIQKRLGDGFYEQKLVAEQILRATGRRNLSGYSSTQASYQALMDEALAESRDLSLVPGVALSQEQIAALRRDIVWMVVEDVRLPDGTMTSALAPKVYFSQFGPMKLNPGGALIAANELNFKSGGVFDNNGAVISDMATTLIVGDLINRGEIQSGGTLYLQAANDISNLSGSISGSNVSLSAGHDIRNERMTKDVSNSAKLGPDLSAGLLGRVSAAGTASTSSTELGLASSITATDGLNMSAGHNLSIVGASVKAGGNASLSAGENITVGTLIAHENSSGAYNAYINRISNLGSQLDVGGNLAMQAGNDLQLTAAKVNAGGDMSLIAGGDINLKSAMNSLARGYDSGVRLEKHDDETVIGTSLNADGNVTLSATRQQTDNADSTNSNNNITLQGASITGKQGDVSLIAAGNVNIGTVAEKHESLTETHDHSSGLFTNTERTTRSETWRTDAIGSSLSGNNIRIASGQDTGIEGSRVNAEHSLDVGAMNNLNIAAATNTYGSQYDSHEQTTGLQLTENYTFTDTGPEIIRKARADGSQQSYSRSSLTSQSGNVNLMAGNNLIASGTDMAAQAGDLALTAGGTVALLAGQDTLSKTSSTDTITTSNFFTKQRRTITDSYNSLAYQGSTAQGNKVTVSSGADIVLQAADVTAGEGGINLDAGHNIKLLTAVNTSSSKHTENLQTDGIIFRFDGSIDDTSERRRDNKAETRNQSNLLNRLLSANDITSHSARDTLIQASVLDAKGAIDLSAGAEASQGQLTLAAVKDSSYSAEEDKHNSMPWQSQSGSGQYTETIRLANIKAGRGLSVNASGGIVVDIPTMPVATPATALRLDEAGNRMPPSTPPTAAEQATQRQASLDKYINTLASQPGQEWIGQLSKLAKEQPDSVKLQQVAAAAQHWDYGAAGLTQEAAAVVVIVVAYFTAGAGSSAVGTTTATAGTSTTAIGGTTLAATSTTAAGVTATTYTVTGAVINAGLSTLASQAAVTILNNKGDVGKTLEDMGKSESVKNVIAAMLTAGVTQNYLRTYNAESFAAKTLAGCVTGDMTGGGCEQGATTAAIMAGSTWVNHAMRTDMVNDSKTFKGVTDANDPTGKIYNNNTGQGSVGIDGSGDRLAGTRVSIKGLQDLGTMTAVTPEDPNTLWSFKGTAINSDTGRAFTLSEALAKQGGPTGGSQALLQTFAAMPVSPGGFLDRLDESFAGPHDYMGGVIQGGYDSLGNWSINNGWGAEVMAGVNIFLVAPLVIPTFMQQINLNPVTLSNTIQNGTR